MSKFTDRLKELEFKNYDDYLSSDYWRNLKKKIRPKICFICGTKKKLQLHHRSYKRLGYEDLRDLLWLCKEHHELLHIIVKEGSVELYTAAHALRKRLRKIDFTELQKIDKRKHKKRRNLPKVINLERSYKEKRNFALEMKRVNANAEEKQKQETEKVKRLLENRAKIL